MRLPPGMRRFGAGILTLQLKMLAGVVGMAGVFVWLMSLFLLALYLESNGIGGDRMAAIVTLAFLVTTAIALFVALKLVRFVDTGEKGLEQAVESAERQDRLYDDALSGGLPGQVSIAPPGAERGGELSPAVGAGALSKREGQED